MPISTVAFIRVPEILVRVIKQEKEAKGTQIGKEKLKLSLLTGGMILYVEEPNDSTKRLLELMRELGEMIGCKANTQKSITFVYTMQWLRQNL